jgi:hypothetical protein
MFALTQKADIRQCGCHARFVPTADVPTKRTHFIEGAASSTSAHAPISGQVLRQARRSERMVKQRPDCVQLF